MCLAIPGRVIDIVSAEDRLGRVDVDGTTRIVNLSLLDDVAVGEWVVVDLGFAVERISEVDAREAQRLLGEMRRAAEKAAS